MSDHYELLGVESDAPREVIRDAYRARVESLDRSLADPKLRDRQSVREEKAAVNRAWTVLADPHQRERYDGARTASEPSDDAPEGSDDPGGGSTPARSGRQGFRERLRQNAERTRREGGRAPGADAAPVMRRLGAAMMDVVVMGAFVVALATVVAGTTDEVTTAVTLTLVVTIVVFVGLYNVVPVMRTGQTLGHRLMKLKTVSAVDGALLDRGAAIRRYSIPVVLVAMGDPFIMVALLLGLSFLFSQTRISLLDRLAKSSVVVADG